MRACGQGYAGLETFASLMNMPKLMTANNYDKIVNVLSAAAKSTAEEVMLEACQELHELEKTNNADDVLDVAVSCDGTWQRRGYSSLNGVVAALSMKTGKIVDVEAMNCSCKACYLKIDLALNDAYDTWQIHIEWL